MARVKSGEAGKSLNLIRDVQIDAGNAEENFSVTWDA